MKVKIIRSNRRTIGIQVNPDLTVTVRAPRYASERDIERILKEKESWINHHMDRIKKFQEEMTTTEHLTAEEIRQLYQQAAQYIPARVQYYAKLMNVTYGRITIRNQKTRWGSCSSKGNLNFNCMLMLAPAEVVDYVVVHELCHRKEMNHSKAFWNEVAKVIPNYNEYENWLKKEGSQIMRQRSR